jgi:hypothetical protein
MAKAAVATRQPVGAERHVPGIHRVQGINSHVEDIRLRGQRFTAVVGGAVVEATLIRRIVGASELTLTVLDPPPARRLLRSKLLEESHELILDGLHWKLVKVANEGQSKPLTLTYEPLVVYLLKRIMGPHKAFRDLQTRAEYAQARAFEAKPRPRFIAPELHVVQDIASAEQGKAAKKKAEESRGKGIGQNPDLKIADKPATKTQVEILERMLRVGESEGANTRVMEALVLAVIDESFVGVLSDNLLQIEPESVSGFSGDPTNPEQSAHGFLRGYESSAPGALGVAKANPDYSAAKIATTVQRNAAGIGPYERFTEEGRAWVNAYGGGTDVGTLSTQRYAFQQSKTESNWKVMNRLANEVHWRCFESAGWIYFLDEPTLLRSHRRMNVSDSAPGIIDTTFDYDLGKEVTQVTVEALAKTWAAPPGSVASVTHHGPADGLYLVEEIETKPSGRKGIANITLKKPTEPLPEPRPKTTHGTVDFGDGSDSSAPQPIQATIAEMERLEEVADSYVFGGNHVGGTPPASGHYDCSSAISRALWAGGLIDHVAASPELMSWGTSGPGDWLTIYSNPEHVFAEVKTASGWRTWQTSSSNPGSRPGWTDQRTDRANFTARHWKGL